MLGRLFQFYDAEKPSLIILFVYIFSSFSSGLCHLLIEKGENLFLNHHDYSTLPNLTFLSALANTFLLHGKDDGEGRKGLIKNLIVG